MSVLQGLMKNFRRRFSFHAKFQVHCSRGLPVHVHVYVHVLSGLRIIIFSRTKRAKKFICLCSRLDRYLHTCEISSSLVLVSEFCVSNGDESHVLLFFIPGVIF